MELSQVTLGAVLPEEEARFRAVMGTHHYLGAAPKVGETLWYGALWRGEWVALASFSAAALKCQARDAWIGWTLRHKYDRLHLVANNTRFLLLRPVPNLGSRVLGLCARHLVRDWPARFHHPLVLLETFVDPSRFVGTVYRAAGWTEVGMTRGFRRVRGGYRAGSTPKKVFVRALTRHARRVLCTPTLEPRYRHGRPRTMLSAEQMRSLPDVFRTITDPRSRYGRRYRLETLLGLAAAATLCGARGYKAIHEWVCDLSPAMLRHFRCRRVNGAYERPSIYCLRNAIVKVAPEELDAALRAWFPCHAPLRHHPQQNKNLPWLHHRKVGVRLLGRPGPEARAQAVHRRQAAQSAASQQTDKGSLGQRFAALNWGRENVTRRQGAATEFPRLLKHLQGGSGQRLAKLCVGFRAYTRNAPLAVGEVNLRPVGKPGLAAANRGAEEELEAKPRGRSAAGGGNRAPHLRQARRTSTTRAANQHRLRAGAHSAASLPLFWWRFTRGEAKVRLRRSRANRALVAESAAQSPESCASLAATMCSMSVSVVDAKHVPVYGPYTAPSSRTMSRSTDWGYG